MKRTTSASCPTCNTLFENLPAQRDEDGLYAVIEMNQCPICYQLLCPCCAVFECDGCSGIYCADHLVSVPDGTDRPLHCCNTCAAGCEPLELPLAIPPQTETRIAAVAEKAVA